MTCSFALTLILAAAPGDPPAASAYLPPPDVQARFEAARAARLEARRAPGPRLPEVRVDPVGGPVRARIEGWIDGAVRVSRPLDRAQRALLERRGVRAVKRVEDIGDEAIFEGRIHRLFRVGRSLQGPAGEAVFERLKGREARLVIGRATSDAHLEILEARAAD